MIKQFVFLFLLAQQVGLPSPGQNVRSQDWKPVWADEFEQSGLPDPRIWSYEEGYVRNDELQYYTRERLENARVEDGRLILEARKDFWKGHEITSAGIHTYGKKSMLFGRIEVKAKLPVGLGTWPAIWMLGNSFKEGFPWPDCGEIDIMENVGFEPDMIHANIHTKAYNHMIKTNQGSKIKADNPSGKFHRYALEWYPDRLDFFWDDQLYFTFRNKNKGVAEWPYSKAHYLILNFAFGGTWGGSKRSGSGQPSLAI